MPLHTGSVVLGFEFLRNYPLIIHLLPNRVKCRPGAPIRQYPYGRMGVYVVGFDSVRVVRAPRIGMWNENDDTLSG